MSDIFHKPQQVQERSVFPEKQFAGLLRVRIGVSGMTIAAANCTVTRQ